MLAPEINWDASRAGLGLHLLAPRILMAQDSSSSREAGDKLGGKAARGGLGPPPPCVNAAPHSRPSSWVSALLSLLPAPCLPGVPRCPPRAPSKQKSAHPELSDTSDHRGSQNCYGFPSEEPAQREGPGPTWTPTPALGPAIWGALDRGRVSHPGTHRHLDREGQVVSPPNAWSEALNILWEGSKSPLDCEDDRTVWPWRCSARRLWGAARPPHPTDAETCCLGKGVLEWGVYM